MSQLQTGDPAPQFTLPNQDGVKIKLSDFKGKKNVVLYFYPKDMTPGCTQEACDFTANKNKISKKDTVILGVSMDSPERHQKFIAKHQINFDLLSDESAEVCQAYDAYQMKNMYGKKFMGIVRSTFIIDKKGKLTHVFPKVKVKDHVEEVLAALAEIK